MDIFFHLAYSNIYFLSDQAPDLGSDIDEILISRYKLRRPMPTKVKTTIQLPTLEELFKAGAHFGHKKEKSDARSRQFVYLVKDRVMIIDLTKTRERLAAALEFVAGQAKEGATFLFVGTKPQVQNIVKKVANDINQPYIISRWPGGLVTNFDSIQATIKRMKKLEESMKEESFERLTKRERQKTVTKLAKFNHSFEGIRDLTALPDILIVVDGKREAIAVHEAMAALIPVVGLVDTNADCRQIAYPIPINDDSPRAVEIILNKIGEQINKNYKTKAIPASEEAKIPAENVGESKAEELQRAMAKTSRSGKK